MMTPPSADRNLLFGILAVQMDFVTQDSLIKAMNAWVLNKSKPLGELLVAEGALSADRRALLEALVEEHLKQHNQDVSQSLAAVSSVTSAREALGQISDQDVQASLAGLSVRDKSGTTQRPQGNAADTLATPMPTMSVNVKSLPGFRYQILRPHAKGGLGEVLVARDQELHREVALKQIQEGRADDPDNQARFLLEAEITGGPRASGHRAGLRAGILPGRAALLCDAVHSRGQFEGGHCPLSPQIARRRGRHPGDRIQFAGAGRRVDLHRPLGDGVQSGTEGTAPAVH